MMAGKKEGIRLKAQLAEIGKGRSAEVVSFCFLLRKVSVRVGADMRNSKCDQQHSWSHSCAQ